MLRIIFPAALIAAQGACGAAFAGGCYADWSVAAPIVRKEGLATVEQLSAQARVRFAGDIVRTTLCEEQGGFVYRLVIRDHDGGYRNKTVDARLPFPP
jgi:hypothetical protein